MKEKVYKTEKLIFKGYNIKKLAKMLKMKVSLIKVDFVEGTVDEKPCYCNSGRQTMVLFHKNDIKFAEFMCNIYEEEFIYVANCSKFQLIRKNDITEKYIIFDEFETYNNEIYITNNLGNNFSCIEEEIYSSE